MRAMALVLVLAGCSGDTGSVVTPFSTPSPTPTPVTAIQATPVATLDAPWSMRFTPDGRMLVTEKSGRLRIVTQTGTVSDPIANVPAVVFFGSQGGLMDVELHPSFATNRVVYLSYVEGTVKNAPMAIAVARAVLTVSGNGGTLSDVKVVWRAPKTLLDGNFGGRIRFGPDGKLYITSGDTSEGASPDDYSTGRGKLIRINDDGSVPNDNPFVGVAGAAPEIWSAGHRNPYGLAWDAAGRLWETEMGPKGGDELNLIQKGKSYGWYFVSEGTAYDDTPIPKHGTRPEYVAPVTFWTPVIAPAGFIIYRGDLFTGWKGQGIITGLVSHGLVRVQFTGDTAAEVARHDLGQRIREVAESPDGALWVLEDSPGNRLLRVTPR